MFSTPECLNKNGCRRKLSRQSAGVLFLQPEVFYHFPGAIVSQSASCNQPEKVRKWIVRDPTDPEGTHIFNSDGLAFSLEVVVINGTTFYWISAKTQDFTDPNQLFTIHCDIQTTGSQKIIRLLKNRRGAVTLLYFLISCIKYFGEK